MRINSTRAVLGLFGLLVCLFAPSLQAQDVPFQGAVTQDNVEILAGGASKYYVVGRVAKGTKVTVKEVIVGYNTIEPPAGVYSYISKAFVDAKGDGKTGVVSADHARVIAASVNGAGESYKPQIDLAKGSTVQIVAEEGSFYKIVPPPGVVVFLPPGTVKRIEGTPAVAATTEPSPTMTPTPGPTPAATPKPTAAPTPKPATAAPAPKPMATPAPVSTGSPSAGVAARDALEMDTPAPTPKPKPHPVATAAPAPRATATPAPSATASPAPTIPGSPAAPATQPAFVPAKAITPQVQALEQRLAAAQDLPVEKQPLEALLKDYDAAGMDPSLPNQDRRIVMTRVAQLKRSVDLANALKSLQQSAAAAGGTAPMAVPAAAAMPPGTYRPTHYDVVGQLLASGIYDGDSGPRLFRLVEPTSMRTIAYVQPGQYDPSKFLGRIVGVMGRAQYDPALKLNVINPTRLDALEASGEPATQPAEEPSK